MAAGLATLRAADDDVYERLDANADRLTDMLSRALTDAGVAHGISRAGNMFSVFFTDAPVNDFASAKASETWRYPAFFHALLDAGVYPPCSAFETWFVSAALDDAAFDRIAAALPGAARAAAEAERRMTENVTEKTIVHVMRHGEVHNPDKILYGRLPDYHLSEKGRAQAQRVADWLADRDIVYVVASPLERAQETATPIAERHGLPIDTDDDLIESANIFQGQKVSPGDGALRDPRNWWHLRNPRKPSWGEPYAEIAERMKAALHRARIKGAGHEAVCVSHQLPVETLRRAVTGKPLHHFPTRRLCNLASLTSFYFHGDSYVGWGYSELAGQ